MKSISVLANFSEFPGLRNCDISDNSGEAFYHNVLNAAFKEAYENNEQLSVDLDNTDGYASSFLDQAFGSLVYDFTLSKVKKSVIIISIEEPHWKEMIETQTYEQWESRRLSNQPPKVTLNHKPWYRLVNNVLELSQWEKSAIV